MQTTIANYMLPAILVVCHLLIVSGTPVTEVTTSIPENVTVAVPTFPEGYVAYPDVGFAYKVYDERETWIAARKRCIDEGAQLALIDTVKKIEYVERQSQSSDYAHVGIVRMYDDAKAWVAVSTGLPIESTLPCVYGCSLDEGDACLEIQFSEMKLKQFSCMDSENFVCELPIIEKPNVSTN